MESEFACTELFRMLWQNRKEFETVPTFMKLMETNSTQMENSYNKTYEVYKPEQYNNNNNSKYMLSTYYVSGTILSLQKLGGRLWD